MSTVAPLDAAAVIRRRRPRIAVIGEFLLDGWWSGSAERLAREAPAAVVEVADRRYAPGGAANAAVNLAALGARVQAVGVIGNDDAGEQLRSLLRAAGVETARLRSHPEARTTTKIRVSAAGQVLLRIDDPNHSPWPAAAVTRFIADARAAARDAEARLICDYGSAALTREVIGALGDSSAPSSAPLTVVDAHDPRRWHALRPHAVTPNAAEAERALGRSLGTGGERSARAAALAPLLRAATGAAVVALTLDSTGSVLLAPDSPPHRTVARPAPEKRASGAGDVFVAALTAARAAKLGWTTAADFAQHTVTAAVAANTGEGTCVCDPAAAPGSAPQPHPSAALSHGALLAELDRRRRAGDRIVFTNGCFDVLHRGHTSYLRQARELGDVLVVALNSDASARRRRGPGSPIHSAADRAAVVGALACVDFVTVFDDDTPRSLIEQIRPDTYAKGGDYTPEMLAETETVRRLGGEVVIVDYVADHSAGIPAGAAQRAAAARTGRLNSVPQ